MTPVILLALIGVPLIEIAVFIEIGGRIGLWPTLAVVILTAVVGTALLRIQGLATLNHARASLARHELPVAEVFDGLCLLVAGAFLLTPGFVTDAFGLLLFVPRLRATLRGALWRYLRTRGGFIVGVDATGMDSRRGANVIEGESHEIPPTGHDGAADKQSPMGRRRERP